MDDKQLIRDILPVELWLQYRLARRKGMDIPRSVLEYFDLMSDEIYEFAHHPPKDMGEALQQVFQYEPSRGRNSFFSRYAQFKTRLAVLANRVWHKAAKTWPEAKTDLADGGLWPLTMGVRSIEGIAQKSTLLEEEARFRVDKESYFSDWIKDRRERFRKRYGVAPLTDTISR